MHALRHLISKYTFAPGSSAPPQPLCIYGQLMDEPAFKGVLLNAFQPKSARNAFVYPTYPCFRTV